MTQPYSEWRAERTCAGKRRYPSRRIAKRAQRGSARTFGETVAQWQAYRCDQCGQWHVGHRAVPGPATQDGAA